MSDLIMSVPTGPTWRVRVPANPADAVTVDAVGLISLLVARNAAHDVVARRASMEVGRAWSVPVERMGIFRIVAGAGQVLKIVTRNTKICAMAAPAERLIRASFDRMPAQIVGSVNEISIHPLGHHHLDRERYRPGVTVLAEILVVTLNARRRR